MTYEWWYRQRFTPVEKVYGTKWVRCPFCDAWMKNFYRVKTSDGNTCKVSKGCLVKFGLCDADFDDPKRVDNPHGSKPWKPKPHLIPFEKLVTGYKFKVLSVGTLPEDTHYWCAFCGGRLKHFVEIIRDDRKKLIVGKRCVRRVGLNPEIIPPDAVPVDATKGDSEPIEKSEKESVLDDEIQDDEIEELLKSLEESGKK